MKLGIMIKCWDGKKPAVSDFFSGYESPHAPYDHPTTYRGGKDGSGNYIEANYYFSGQLYAINLSVLLTVDDSTTWDNTKAYNEPTYREYINGPKHFYSGGQAYVNKEDIAFFNKAARESYECKSKYLRASICNDLKTYSLEHVVQEAQNSICVWISVVSVGHAIDILKLLAKTINDYDVNRILITAIETKKLEWSKAATQGKSRKIADTRLIPNNENLYAAGNEYCACGTERLDYGWGFSVIRHPISRKILLAWSGKSVGTAINGFTKESAASSALTSQPVFGTSINTDTNTPAALFRVKCCGPLAQAFVIDWNTQTSSSACRKLLEKADATGPLSQIIAHLKETIVIWDKEALEMEIPKQLAIEKELRHEIISSTLNQSSSLSQEQLNTAISSAISKSREGLDFWGADLLPLLDHYNLTSQEGSELLLEKSALNLDLGIKNMQSTKQDVNQTSSSVAMNISRVAPLIPITGATSLKTVPFSELKVGENLGSGGFGTVYKATWNSKNVAIKQLNVLKLNNESIEEFKNESEIMARLQSPRLVCLYGICVSPDPFCMIMEYMPKGSLWNVLHGKENYEWRISVQIAVDICAGLTILHKENIIHRDLKSPNVLIDENFRAKIADFGLSKVRKEISTTTTKSAAVVGTYSWMAPELFGLKPKYSFASDIYANGIILREIFTREAPYKDVANDVEIRDAVKSGEREEIPTNCPSVFRESIELCWAHTPDKRPTATQVAGVLQDYLNTLQPAESKQQLKTTIEKIAALRI